MWIDKVYFVVNYVEELRQFIKVGFMQEFVDFGDVWVMFEFLVDFLFMCYNRIVGVYVFQDFFCVYYYGVQFVVVEYFVVFVDMFLNKYVWIVVVMNNKLKDCDNRYQNWCCND